VAGMASQDRGDREGALRRSYVTASSCAGVELVAVPLSRVSSCSFEGRDREEVGSWWHSVTESHRPSRTAPTQHWRWLHSAGRSNNAGI
jgi:hypothetical protein